MKKDQLFLSTIAPDAAEEARRHGLGLEIAEYCTAWNMDEQFETTHAAVTEELTGVGRRLLHAPFSELFPCAVDPKARELAALRYRQAIALARRYDARKIIIHGGFNERLYYPCWYTEQSIVFWKDFLKEDPGVDIVLENVLEEQPEITDDDAVKEIAANMGAGMGSSITITDDAGSQLLSDLGRSAIQGVSQYVSKKMRSVKVTLKAGYSVLLLPPLQ